MSNSIFIASDVYLAIDTEDSTFRILRGEEERTNFVEAYRTEIQAGRIRYYRMNDIDYGWYKMSVFVSNEDIAPHVPIAW